MVSYEECVLYDQRRYGADDDLSVYMMNINIRYRWHKFVCFFFFQAEDGIRDLVRSRGLGDVYKRQAHLYKHGLYRLIHTTIFSGPAIKISILFFSSLRLSLIHI